MPWIAPVKSVVRRKNEVPNEGETYLLNLLATSSTDFQVILFVQSLPAPFRLVSLQCYGLLDRLHGTLLIIYIRTRNNVNYLFK